MGYSSKPSNVRLCLNALETCLLAQNVTLDAGAALAAANAIYAK